jgi:hypothetical protein
MIEHFEIQHLLGGSGGASASHHFFRNPLDGCLPTHL